MPESIPSFTRDYHSVEPVILIDELGVQRKLPGIPISTNSMMKKYFPFGSQADSYQQLYEINPEHEMALNILLNEDSSKKLIGPK